MQKNCLRNHSKRFQHKTNSYEIKIFYVFFRRDGGFFNLAHLLGRLNRVNKHREFLLSVMYRLSEPSCIWKYTKETFSGNRPVIVLQQLMTNALKINMDVYIIMKCFVYIIKCGLPSEISFQSHFSINSGINFISMTSGLWTISVNRSLRRQKH